jgi:O-antigen/teichoic acid export membrane protein
MGIESYGLVGFYTTLSSLLGVLDFGIGATLNRQLAKSNSTIGNIVYKRNLVRTFEILYWSISIFAGLVIFLLAPLISHYWISTESFSKESVVSVIQFMGIAFALQFPISLYQGGLLGLQKYLLLNSLLIFTSIVRNVGVLSLLVFNEPTIHMFFKGQSLFNLFSSLFFMFSVWLVMPKNSAKPAFSKRIVYDNWKFALAVSASSIIGVFLSQLDKVILTSILPLKTFAYYSVAATVASAVWMLIIPFNTAIFPKLVQLNEKKHLIDLQTFFHESSQKLALILLPICSIFIFYSEHILRLWMNDPQIVSNSHLIVSLLVVGILLNGLVSVPIISATAFGWPSLVTYTNLIQAIFIIPLILLLVHYFQAIGAAIAWVIMNSTYIIFSVPIFFKKHLKGDMLSWYFKDTLTPLIISFTVSYTFYLLFPFEKTKYPILNLMFIGSIIFTVTLLGLSTIRKPLIKKVKYLIQNIQIPKF